ncbi:MAG TPA: thioredoxin [Candidatus Dependentiae bacterium]|jgi:thioredoxin 1|nr:thioredoxin [Candidatus Dependentiae bacterium]
MVVTITKQNAEQEISKSTLPVVIKVHATWCGPCQQMAPIYEELSKELAGKYKFAQLNVDDARELSIQYGVTSIPTFIFIKNNEVVGKEVGYMGKEELKAVIEGHLK